MKHVLIVFHSQTGRTRRLAQAVESGVLSAQSEGVQLRSLWAQEAGSQDLLWADAVLLGSPENFGYMSGAMKDFFDRTFYAVEGQVQSLPYAVFISAGNDGTGALRSITRIVRGFPWREIQDAIIVKGEVQPRDIAQCEELGACVATGLALGIF